jgi:hypothetical protein
MGLGFFFLRSHTTAIPTAAVLGNSLGRRDRVVRVGVRSHDHPVARDPKEG